MPPAPILTSPCQCVRLHAQALDRAVAPLALFLTHPAKPLLTTATTRCWVPPPHVALQTVQVVHGAWALWTIVGHNRAWVCFNHWCNKSGVPKDKQLHASELVICVFAASCLSTALGATACNNIAGIRACHMAISAPWHNRPWLKLVLKGIKRAIHHHLGSPSDRLPPSTTCKHSMMRSRTCSLTVQSLLPRALPSGGSSGWASFCQAPSSGTQHSSQCKQPGCRTQIPTSSTSPGQRRSICLATLLCWKQGCAPNFWLFLTMGTCSGHALWTYVCFWTPWTSQTCFGLSRFRLWWSRSHGYPIIARTRSTELCRSSAASPYVLTIASSCSADSGLTQPPAAAYAYCMIHAVLPSMYLSAPGLASCSSVRPLGHWDR
jgi:hypothetical protein